MQVLLLIACAVTLIWLAVLWRFRPTIGTNLLLLLASATLVASVVFGREFYSLDLGPLPLSIDRLLLAVLLAGCCYQFATIAVERLNWDWLDSLVAAWFVGLVLSTFLTDWRFRDGVPLTRLLFLNFLPLLVYVVIKHTPGTVDCRLRGLAWSLAGLSVYLAMTAVAEWRGWHGLVFPRHILDASVSEFLGRGRGPLQNPIINGMLMVTCGSALLVISRGTRVWQKSLLLGALIVIAAGLVATLTRSVWIAAFLSAVTIAMSLLSGRLRIALAVVLICAVPVGWWASGPIVAQFKRDQHVSAEDMARSVSLRPMFAIVAWEMFQDRPWFGVGFAQYPKYKVPYHFDDRYDRPLQPALAYFQHNVFLSYLVDMGLMGLALLLAVLIGVSIRSYQVWRYASVWEMRAWGLVGIVAVINYSANGMFHDTSIIPQSNMLLLFCGGVVGRHGNEIEAGRLQQSSGTRDLRPALAPKLPQVS